MLSRAPSPQSADRQARDCATPSEARDEDGSNSAGSRGKIALQKHVVGVGEIARRGGTHASRCIAFCHHLALPTTLLHTTRQHIPQPPVPSPIHPSFPHPQIP